MKKTAYVIADDLLHPIKRYLPQMRKYFNFDEWHVTILTELDSICIMSNAPDLIVSMKDGQTNWRQATPYWYDTPVSYKFADFVKKEGCGYVAIHSGLDNIPDYHPIKTNVLQAAVNNEPGKFHFWQNMLFGKINAPNAFACFDDITFKPEKIDHPILKGVPEFTIRDEQYKVDLEPNADITVLGTSNSVVGSTIGAWCRQYGEGRVVGISMGHLQSARENGGMVLLIKNAIEWAARK